MKIGKFKNYPYICNMKYATLDDLKKEAWLRCRNAGEIVWRTKEGKEIPIKEMSDQHLLNAINRLIDRNEFNEIAAEYNAYIEQHFG